MPAGGGRSTAKAVSASSWAGLASTTSGSEREEQQRASVVSGWQRTAPTPPASVCYPGRNPGGDAGRGPPMCTAADQENGEPFVAALRAPAGHGRSDRRPL